MPGPSHERRLIIVSGMSGGGKSIALHALEDLGYYCIDNLPAGFLEAVVDDLLLGKDQQTKLLAVAIDARNRAEDLARLPELINNFRSRDLPTDVIFIRAERDVLLERYRQTRRRHPLADGDTELREAIDRETHILSELASIADLIVDTSSTSVYDLADTLKNRVDRRRQQSMSVLIESFGFKKGIPADADFVFDLRALPNPYWTVKLRSMTGLDPAVIEFLDHADNVDAMHDDIVAFLSNWIPRWQAANRGYMTVAIGCTGGQHRSVYMTERVAKSLAAIHEPVTVRHSALSQGSVDAHT